MCVCVFVCVFAISRRAALSSDGDRTGTGTLAPQAMRSWPAPSTTRRSTSQTTSSCYRSSSRRALAVGGSTSAWFARAKLLLSEIVHIPAERWKIDASWNASVSIGSKRDASLHTLRPQHFAMLHGSVACGMG
eukprot:6179084-Pleurochrysis_carterae.AAC.1